MMHGKIEPDNGAITPAYDGSLIDLEIVHEPDDVRRHEVVAIGLAVAGTASVAAAVHDHHFVVLLQHRNLLAPVVAVRKAAMEQDYGLSVAEDCVPDPDAIHRRIATAECCRQSRGRRQGQPLRSCVCLPGTRHHSQSQEKCPNSNMTHGTSVRTGTRS
jgi:hypothetical protein